MLELLLKTQGCSFGVLLNPGLLLDAQVTANIAFYQPYLVTVTHAVSSRLYHSHVLQVRLPLKTVQKLQFVQIVAAGLLLRADCTTHIAHTMT